MPNYRQKNKKNKNKNRQKQQQPEQNNKSNKQNPNQQAEAHQQQQTTHENRPSAAGTAKDNQSQGRPVQSKTNQQRAPKSPKLPASSINPTPTALDSTSEPQSLQSPTSQAISKEDAARKVDTTGQAVANVTTTSTRNVKCHNLNSNVVAPTTIHQQVNKSTPAVQHEECTRIEDANANAHHTKLANRADAAYNETPARGEESKVISNAVVAIEEDSIMGNRDSKTFITSNDDGGANVAAVASDTISKDQKIAGECKEPHVEVAKAKMAKVIVHRIVPVEANACVEEKVQKSEGISKDAEVAIGKVLIEDMSARKSEEDINHRKQENKGQAKVSQSAQKSKVIVHKIAKENGEDQLAKQTVENKAHATDAQEQQTIQATNQTQQKREDQKVIVHTNSHDHCESKSIKEAGALTNLDEEQSFNETQEPNDDPKVIIHQIQVEATSPPPHYQVELPDADSPTSPLSKSPKQTILNKSIVYIQELSDESSSEYNDNPPLISEAESETESTAGACALDYSQQIRTLSPDSEDNYELVGAASTSPTYEQQDPKQRRAQKRVALESHFLPQLLSPRYLDSILEENSDMSDTRSDCSENPLIHTHSGEELHDATASKVRKANEIFPRSKFDFSRRHAAKKQFGALPKKPTMSIREEPVAMVVAAKLIDDATTQAQECCTRLSSAHTPESEAAEVIYLSSSASSSLSDLLELDAEAESDGAEDEHDSSRSIIDLDTDVHEIIAKPGAGGGGVHDEEARMTATAAPTLESSDSRESTPVNQLSTATAITRLSDTQNEAQKMLANNHNNRSEGELITTAAEAAQISTNIDAVIAENNRAIGNHQHLESAIFENMKSLQLLATTSDEREPLSICAAYSAPAAKASASTSTASESETETELSSATTTTTTERCDEYFRSSDSDGNQSSSGSIISSIESKYRPGNTLTTSDSLNVDPAVLLENIELEMNNVRDILNSHITDDASSAAAITPTYGNGNDTRTSELKLFANFLNSSSANKASSPSPPPIPPPPTGVSASDFHSDFVGVEKIQAHSETSAPPPPIPTRAAPADIHNFTTHTSDPKSPQSASASNSFSSIKSALNSLSLLGRQESTESHCSDSTQHSYCTAINVGSYPQDTNSEHNLPLTANSPLSDEPQYNSWKYTSGADDRKTPTNLTSAPLEDAPIKKLRLLCTETLASMPYGEQVLVELATVAQNISELQAKPPQILQDKPKQQALAGATMPYPLPQLPHISELQLSIAKDVPTPQHPPRTHHMECSDPARITRNHTSANILHQAPPVPTPPAHYSNGRGGGDSDAPWLGVPTSADPNVLVCLSPAQQQQLTAGSSTQTIIAPHSHTQPPADQLLDAHKKFLERRGYHEFSEEQVKSLNADVQKEEEQILKMAAYMKKLRKSLTPPPPPVPPPPVPSKSSETVAKARTVASAANSSIGSSAVSSHSQNAYDATTATNTTKYRSEQQRTVTFANGEESVPAHTGKPADFVVDAVSVAGSSAYHHPTSSIENNSRQMSGAAVGSALDFAGKQLTNSVEARQYSKENASEATSAQVLHSLYGDNNQEKIRNQSSFPSASSANKMQGVESELAKMFPSMGSSNIFDSDRKRFSNIESSSSASGAPYCVQLQSTLPKRYSNIETHSWEAKKRMENGEVVYDYSDARHEQKSDGDKSLQSASLPSLLTHFPVKEAAQATKNQYPIAGDDGISHRSNKNSEIMSEIKLNTTTDTDAKTNVGETKESEKPNRINMTNFHYSGVPNHNHADNAANFTTNNSATSSSSHFSKTTKEEKTTIREENISKNSQVIGGGAVRPISSGGDANASSSNSAFEEFRQHAKADTINARGVYSADMPATAPPIIESNNSKHSAFNFQQDKLFKDFDTLTQQLHNELAEGKAQREQREKSASLYDLSRMQWNSKDHFERLKKERHEHMKELEREIERSARSRQSKGWTNGMSNEPPSTAGATAAGRTFDIPIRIEQRVDEQHANSNGYAHHATGDRSSAQPRAYNVPIQLENGAAPSRPSNSYDTVDDASRFRRAESMFNLSENSRRPQPQAQPTYATYERPKSTAVDDWARYASDFGSSENIARPFAREVEICYQRQRPRTIRAPRLSASTNDLSSSTQSYDTYNAYNVRRTHAPMMQPVSKPQQLPSHHTSCYSVLERDPNPTYISTTTRRGVSPAPMQHPPPQEPLYTPVAPERSRRASLPREIHEQQLKYISSKEEELRMEFERLQNERRRLTEELNTTPTLQMPQHPMRDIYRPVPKLPTLTEDEVFRQQMAEEWLNKVAEREERRLQKIIKISKVNEAQLGHKPDISDEFLKRVHERRTKLAMPADSDWESGAESQPARPGHASESDAEGGVPIKVIEGKSEADLRQLPRHLREFARFSNHNEEKIDGGHRVEHQEEERRHEANANSMSSALKKSSVVKTVKIARHPEVVGEPSHRVPASVQHQYYQQPQQGYRRMSSGGEQVYADETAPFSTELPPTPPYTPLFSDKLPVTPSFEEMFATSPFKSRILDEFDRFWRNFDHTT